MHAPELEDEDSLPPLGLVSVREIPVEDSGLRADLAIGHLFPEYSRSRLQEWIKAGRVLVNGALVVPKQKLLVGDRVEVPPPPAWAGGEILPEAIPFPVVFEDDELIVIDKPVGLVVHPGSGNWTGTLQNGLLHRYPELKQVPRNGLVHRLDKDTSGLMVVARTLRAHADLVAQLQARTVRRHYAALVLGDIEFDGTVEAPIGRHPTMRTRMAVIHGGREAVTHYFVWERYPGVTLVECRLETGRTHQIRVHLQHAGFPLLGDPVYGVGVARLKAFPAEVRQLHRQALHAFRLGLMHPASKQSVEWSTALAPDLIPVIEALRRHHDSHD